MTAKKKSKKSKKSSKKGVNIDPAPGYIVIEPMEAEEKTPSGIYLPESASEKPLKGRVVAVGSEQLLDSGLKKPSPAKVGDVVIYKKWGGSEVKVQTKDYLFAKFDDILAVVRE